MSATASYMALDLALPWSVNEERDRRFNKRLQRVGVVLLVLFIVVPFLPTWDVSFGALPPEPTVRTQVILTPPKLPEPAKPVQEALPPPPPPPPQPKPQAQPKAAETASKPAAAAPQPQALAALSSLKSMPSKVDVSRLQNRNLSVKGGEASSQERATLGDDNLSTNRLNTDLNVAVKGAALGGHRGTSIDSPIAAMDLPDEGGEWTEGSLGRRDMESIRRTIENAKGQVYALYARALRQHPDLSGKFVFELVVEPDGTVTRLKLIQSDLRLRDLEQQMLDKIASIHFGKEKAAPTRVQYTFVMIPS